MTEIQVKSSFDISLNGFQVEKTCRPDDKDGIAYKVLPEIKCTVENLTIKIPCKIRIIGIYCTANKLTPRGLNSLLTGNITIVVGDFNARHENRNCLSRNRNGNILNSFLNLNTNCNLHYTDKPTHFPINNSFHNRFGGFQKYP